MPHNYGALQSFVASADLSAKQFYVVEISGNNTVNAANAATDAPVGILMNKPTSGQAAAVMTQSGARVPAMMDGTADIAAGAWLGPNASGVLVLKATADFSVCARALEACTTNGLEIHDVLWLGPGFWRAALG